MNTWYEVVVKGTRQGEKREQKIIEKYLLDALSFTEAEKRAVDEIFPYFPNGDARVAKINPIKVSEIMFSSGDLWFKCKVNFITLIEKTGKEKKQPCYMYVQADNTKEAEEHLNEGMKGTMVDWNLESIVETKIIDILKYNLEKAAEELEKKTEE